MSKGKRKFLTVVGVVAVIAVFVLVSKLTGGDENFREKYEGANLETSGEFERTDTYAAYLKGHEGSARPQGEEIVVDLMSWTNAENTEKKTNYEGEASVLFQDDGGHTEWQVTIPEAGLYRVYIEYFPVASRGVSMERSFAINGEVPFNGSDALTFTRRWADATEIKTDNQGNDRRPSQIEKPDWCSAYFTDYMGYYTDPYEYYFNAGTNTIALDAVNEPMAIRKLAIRPVEDALTYEEYLAACPQVKGGEDHFKEVQGEASTVRSAQSLYARSDHASANTVPYSVTQNKLNYGGGEQWRVAGQWIEWDFTVPADGFYNITVKSRQSYNRGRVSNRAVYIDGVIPFDELSAVAFPYSTEWMNVTLADAKGNPYNIYLTEGTHTIRMEVTMGDLGSILNELQDSVIRMNDMYRTILVYTGATPDKNRDYDLDKVYPEVMEAMEVEYKRLYKTIDDYVAYTGELSGDIATVQKIAKQMETFVKKPERISKQFATFKSNISSVGTSIMNMAEAPLDIDLITVTGVNAKPKEIETSFFKSAGHTIRSFVASFTVDYDALGNVYAEDEAITVWITAGRDQSNVLKALVDDVFYPTTGIPVNVKLVQAGMLLSATLAGTGPDVAIQVAQGDPVNYALRNAAEPINQFEGWEEVLDQYPDSAVAPYWFEGDLYGIPMTHVYNVMFYRTDILEELGVEAPRTWNDLIDMLPTLQQNNLEVAVPSTERLIGGTANPDLSTFIALLYQNGGSMYNDTLTKSTLASEAGVKAFEMYTSFYSDYGLPVAYDFANRFRSGEMPIGMQDYDTYNTLAVLAPEIRGLWEFSLIPGTAVADYQADGTELKDEDIDRSASSWGTASMIIKDKKRSAEMTQNCWEFMKWWADHETQTRYGRELEAVMGTSARYQTANKLSFEELPWSTAEKDILREQWSWTEQVPEIPGGYFVTRHVTNAARKVYNEKMDPRETLLDYVDTINDEITKKREEFGLPIDIE